jgi:hypothetical protein
MVVVVVVVVMRSTPRAFNLDLGRESISRQKKQ